MITIAYDVSKIIVTIKKHSSNNNYDNKAKN